MPAREQRAGGDCPPHRDRVLRRGNCVYLPRTQVICFTNHQVYRVATAVCPAVLLGSGGGRWWIALLVGAAFSSAVVAQPPCQTPGCTERWVERWIPRGDTGELLQGPLHSTYPNCRIRIKVWARCCNGVKQLYIAEVEVLGDSCTLARDVEEGRLSAVGFMDEVTITAAVKQGELQVECFDSVHHCSEGGNYYYEVFRISCFGWDSLPYWNKPRDDGEGGITHIRSGPRWVPCGTLCCFDGWLICRTDPPCTSPNRDPCISAVKIQEGVTTERCPSTIRVSSCKAVCKGSSYGNSQSGERMELPYIDALRTPGEVTVQVYDILGRKVAEYRYLNEQNWTEKEVLHNLVRGIYFVVHRSVGNIRVNYLHVP